MKKKNPLIRFAGWFVPEASTILRFTAWAMSDNIKRKIVMVAGFCEAERMRGAKVPRVDQLNEVLHIVTTESLLFAIRDFAMALSDELFRCGEEPCPTDMAAVCLHLAERVPSFLKYADHETMVSDLATVVVFEVR